MPVEAIILAGALCGGFVTGLSGFGTGLTALGFWLYVLDPAIAAALVVTCSVIGQVQSLCTVRRAVSWTRLWPFLIGGVAGVPLGVMALRLVEAQALKGLLGVFLVGYAGLMLSPRQLPVVSAWGGRLADGIVGIVGIVGTGGTGGGVLGGLSGLPGPLPTIWCGLRGWRADLQRGVCQPFNLVILCIALSIYAVQGLLTREVWQLTLLCAPAMMLGTHGGMRLYRRIDDRQFRHLVLWLLLASGLVLGLSNLTAP